MTVAKRRQKEAEPERQGSPEESKEEWHQVEPTEGRAEVEVEWWNQRLEADTEDPRAKVEL